MKVDSLRLIHPTFSLRESWKDFSSLEKACQPVGRGGGEEFSVNGTRRLYGQEKEDGEGW